MTSTFSLPDFLPLLTEGAGDAAAGTACAMSAVHWMEGGQGDSDAPECVHPILRATFVEVNDADFWVNNAHRTRVLWPLIARAMGTAPTGTDEEQTLLDSQLCLFIARYIVSFASEQNREIASRAVDSIEQYLAGITSAYECRTTVVDAKNIMRASGDGFSYVSDTINHVMQTILLEDRLQNIGVHASHLMRVMNYATQLIFDTTEGEEPVVFLTALIDEHARLTGHLPIPLDLRGLDNHIEVITV